ncbi:glycine cleavage system aminomethyltransferase GcvT [Candidatus Woesearchaeota archaeon]|nr:glycine cleavage system aminomethyltransferase GcvT [Candidatus Woesearchaeota archaeon]
MKKTVLYDEHEKLGAKMIEFNGWLMPVYYTSVIDEHNTTRNAAGLFDICHMGEIIIKGNDAFKFVQKLVTNDLNKLTKGKAFYAAMCYENGATVDDLFVYFLDNNEYMLVVNASNTEKDLEWIKKNKNDFDVEIIDKSNETAKLDLQGPKAEEILQKLTDVNLKELKRFNFIEGNVNDVKTIISRTGYTGGDGFELYFTAKKAVEIWNKLLEAGKEVGLKAVGLGARDTLRVEACYSLYGHELNDQISPIEAGIGFVVKLDKDEFIGKKSLLEIKNKQTKKVIAFEMIDRGIPRANYEIKKNNEKIGFVSSGTFSPTLKKNIGLGIIDINEANTDNEIDIMIRDKSYKAKVVKRPFYAFNKK